MSGGLGDHPADDAMAGLWQRIPHLRVRDGDVVHVSAAVASELERNTAPLLGPLGEIGTRLDDTTFEELLDGVETIRVRLGHALDDRPVRLRHLGTVGDETWVEIRSLADQFRLESLLRRSGYGHMLISPEIILQWSMSSNDLSDVLPGDNPLNWVELMDADDMQTLGQAIAAVGADPNLHRTVSHRLNADRTYTIIDTVESAMHDPDLGAVLVRSRLADAVTTEPNGAAPYAGLSVSDHMPIGVIVASLAGKVLHRNAVAAQLVGARAGQLVVPDGDEPWMMDRLGQEQSAQFQSVFAAAAAGQSAHCTVASPFEAQRWLRISISPAVASTVVMTVEDMTDLAEAERAVRASNRLLEALDSHSEDLVLVFDAVGRRRYASSSALRRLRNSGEIAGTDDLVEFVHEADRTVVADLLRRVQANPSASGAIEFRVTGDDDHGDRWHHATMTNLLDDPDVHGLVLTVRDIHERHLVERELRFKATHDALTTLPDRSALQSQLEALLRDAGTHRRTALMFCDIDNFKLINDRAGHRVGDLVLTEVADRLRGALRGTDFVGRFGGDEFVVVAPDVDGEEHAVELAERVFSAVTGVVRCDDIDVDVSVSMGLAITDAECTTAAGLLHRGDVAMYEAKREGRGRLALYSSDGGAEDETEGLRDDLEAAIYNGQLTLHYQQMVPLRDGLVRGYESLARWDHPVLGTIDAKRFLDLAENAGLSAALGDELIRLACDDQRTWIADDEGFVAVNLSSSQLSEPEAAFSFLTRMRRRGVPTAQIVIELTEAAFAQGPIVQRNLEVFREAGVRVFLDDFGVGYSSLSHLHRFPVDGIKIDASVINPDVDENLVRLIVGVATTLGIQTVAEGVETAEQLDVIRRLGVDYAQGYLLGRPSRTPTSQQLP